MNKIALFTDIHFGIHQNSKEWIDITFKWLQSFKKECLKENIKEIIFCGDFFNPRDVVTWQTVDYGKICIDYLRKDFKLHLLVGNHCCFFKDKTDVNSLNIFKGLENVNVYDQPASVTINDKQFLFIPWCDDDKLNLALNYFSGKFDAIIGHFEINSFKMSGRVCENNISSERFFSKTPLVFTGHFHLRQIRKYNNGEIVYIGNPFQMDYSDEGSKKGFCILNTDDMSYSFIDNNISPIFSTIQYSKWKNIKDDKRESIIQNNFITMVFDEKINQEEIDKVVANIYSYLPKQLTIDLQNVNEIDINKDIQIDLIDIKSSFNKFIDMIDFKNKNKLNKYILEIYEQSI